MPIPQVDPSTPPSRLKRQAVRFALTKPGTWYGINVASRVDPHLMRWTRGRFHLSRGALPVVLLTTRGRKSGLERTVPLAYFTDGDDVILMASSFGRARYPAWYHNLKANPEVKLTGGGTTEPYRAAEVEGAERDELFDKAKQLYSGYGIYEERTSGIRRVPVLRLSPIASSTSPNARNARS